MSKKNAKNLKSKDIKNIDVGALAHEGTKEAIDKIKAYMEAEKDPNKKLEAEIAMEECEYFYYNPQNEREEKEFLLCELIHRREESVSNDYMELEKLKMITEEHKLEMEVHKKVLAANKNKKEDWEYFCIEEMVFGEKNRVEELKDNISYNKAWIKEAKKSITTKRYQPCIPEKHMHSYCFNDGHGEELEEDERRGLCDCDK